MIAEGPHRRAGRRRANPYWTGLLVIVLATATARGALALHVARARPDVVFLNDSPSYIEPARALVADGSFVVRPGARDPMFVRTPGYPLFLALLHAIGVDQLPWLCAIQAAVSSLTVVLTFLLARELWSAGVAAVAALLVAVEPLQVWASGVIMTEWLSALLLTGSALLGALALSRAVRPLAHFMAFGALLAIATYVRPVTFYFPYVLIVGLLVLGRPRMTGDPPGGKRFVMGGVAFLVPWAVLVGGWQVRNKVCVGSFRFSAIEAVNMYLYRGAGVEARLQRRPFVDVRDEMRVAFGPRQPTESQGAYYDRMFAEGKARVVAEPLTFARVTAGGLVSLVLGVRTTITAYLGVAETSMVVSLSRAGLVVVLALALWGAATSIRGAPLEVQFKHVVPLGLAAYVVIVSAGPEAYSRMRAPIMPILCAYCAAGIAQCWMRIRRRTGPAGGGAHDDEGETARRTARPGSAPDLEGDP